MADEGLICRICRTGNEENHPVRKPCECRGTMQHVHEDCLIEWLIFTRRKQCEICKFDYNVKVSYRPNCSNILVGCFSLLQLLYCCVKLLTRCTITAVVNFMWLVVPKVIIKLLELSSKKQLIERSSVFHTLMDEVIFGYLVLLFVLFVYFYAVVVTIKSTTGVERRKLERTVRRIKQFVSRKWRYIPILSSITGIIVAATLGYVPFYIGHYLSVEVIPTELIESNVEFQVLPKILLGQSLILLYVWGMQRLCELLQWSRFLATMRFLHRLIKALFIVLLQYCLLPMLCGFWCNICISPGFEKNLKFLITWNSEEPFGSMFAYFFTGMYYMCTLWIIKNNLKQIVHPNLNVFLNYFDAKIWFSGKLYKLSFLEYSKRILHITVVIGVITMLQFLIPMKILKAIGIFNSKWYQSNIDVRFALFGLLGINNFRLIFESWCYFTFPLVGLKHYLIPTAQLDTYQLRYVVVIDLIVLRVLIPVRVQQVTETVILPSNGIFYFLPRCCALAALWVMSALAVIFTTAVLDSVISSICFMLEFSENKLAKLILTVTCITFIDHIIAAVIDAVEYYINVLFRLSVLMCANVVTLFIYKSISFRTYLYVFGNWPHISQIAMVILIMTDVLVISCIIYGPRTSLQQAIFALKDMEFQNIPVQLILSEILLPFLRHVGLLIALPMILEEFIFSSLFNNFYLEFYLKYYIYVLNCIIQNYPAFNICINCIIHQLTIIYNQIKLEHFSNEIRLANYDEVAIEENIDDQHIVPLNALPENIFNNIFNP
ncbi:uncharacterized protein LOC119672635 [Teleopsis dalmanni]|uniref:uncharacterized protein LOC119672635 n=1 Tax=Teleopsis dalmanni TaxID=139649 RepID=UPI0018CDA3A9|nr:uncharacterized protein LOC119672635 [Teleopsis dalmanni]XP_037939664.1 uncharacterized protein LOC119672635 [Teleopsis dalmanni]